MNSVCGKFEPHRFLMDSLYFEFWCVSLHPPVRLFFSVPVKEFLAARTIGGNKLFLNNGLPHIWHNGSIMKTSLAITPLGGNLTLRLESLITYLINSKYYVIKLFWTVTPRPPILQLNILVQLISSKDKLYCVGDFFLKRCTTGTRHREPNYGPAYT